MTLVINSALGEYYGVQGTTWQQPADPQQPDADRDRRRQEAAGLYANGGKLSLVAWRTPQARLLGLEHADRHASRTGSWSAIAASLTPYGGLGSPETRVRDARAPG